MNSGPEADEKVAELESRIESMQEALIRLSDSVIKLEELLYAIAERIIPPEEWEDDQE